MKIKLAIIILAFFSIGWEAKSQDIVKKNFELAEIQYQAMLKKAMDITCFPRTVKQDKLWCVPAEDWTSGFWPGILWYMYEYTKNNRWKDEAMKWTHSLKDIQFFVGHHDVGFMMYCSYGNGFRLTANPKYIPILVQSAKSLCKRYSYNVGCIQSWNARKSIGRKNTWEYPVIIDNMMNLELLLWASKNSSNTRFGEIARSHADVTMKYHFRPDYSCYHVVSYDTITGKPDVKGTYQGYADDSDWARGQGWALYGYTMMYRETKQKKYLDQAIHVAKFIMGHPQLPKDKIPYWDFDDPAIPNTPRDASAGALIASALIELSQYTESKFSKECLAVAETQIRTLSSPEYLAVPGTNCNFILKHSVGNKPKKKEVDVPLTYADYYYVEALLRYKKNILREEMGLKQK